MPSTYSTVEEFAAAAVAGHQPVMPSHLTTDERKAWGRAAVAACRSRDIAAAQARKPVKSAAQVEAERAETARLAAEPGWMKETRTAYREIVNRISRGQQWADGFITRLAGGPQRWHVTLPALGWRAFDTRREAREWIASAPAALRLRAAAHGFTW